MMHRQLAKVKEYALRHPVRLTLLLFTAFCILIYLPFVLRGEFMYDDWSVARLGYACPGIVNSITCYWPSYAHRPLDSLYYALTTNIFHAWTPGYILVALGAWLAGTLLIFKVFLRRFELKFASVFLFVAAIPAFSNSVIFSPAMQSTGAVSFLLFGAAFYFLDEYWSRRASNYLILGILLLACSVFTYESSIPLIPLLVAWPFILGLNEKKLFEIRKYLYTYVLPILSLVCLLIIYQKIIVVHLSSGASSLSKFRLFDNGSNLINFGFRILFKLFYSFTFGLTGLILQALHRLQSAGLVNGANITLLLVVIITVLFLSIRLRSKQYVRPKGLNITILVIILTLGLMHFVALQSPSYVGYVNRGMVGASVTIAIIFAALWHRYAGSAKVVTTFVLGTLIIGYIAIFVVQRNATITASLERKTLEAQLVSSIKQQKPSKKFIIAALPLYSLKNFNDEVVFSDEVLDLTNMLYVRTRSTDVTGITLSRTRVNRGEIQLVNHQLKVIGSKDVPLDMIWYYEPATGSLTPVHSDAQIEQLIKTAPDVLNIPSADAKTREQLRAWLDTY